MSVIWKPLIYGVRRLGSLGNIDVFLMLSSPRNNMVTLSIPEMYRNIGINKIITKVS